jgi:hypothetical protein
MRQRPASSRIALLILCFGVFLLVGVPAGWNVMHGAVDAGMLPARGNPAADRAALSSRRGVFPANIGAHSARLRDAEAIRQEVDAPVKVSIAGLGVRARIVPVGVVRLQGTMEVPRDIRLVGWYQFGPSPGEPGSAILIGHVDSRAQGRGAFFGLAHLRIGATILVESENGKRSTFSVVARRSYPKDRLPLRVFDRTGPPTLTLVTCGGYFDERTRHYADNIVIFAVAG